MSKNEAIEYAMKAILETTRFAIMKTTTDDPPETIYVIFTEAEEAINILKGLKDE